MLTWFCLKFILFYVVYIISREGILSTDLINLMPSTILLVLQLSEIYLWRLAMIYKEDTLLRLWRYLVASTFTVVLTYGYIIHKQVVYLLSLTHKQVGYLLSLLTNRYFTFSPCSQTGSLPSLLAHKQVIYLLFLLTNR